jgi:hypothetical protein
MLNVLLGSLTGLAGIKPVGLAGITNFDSF